MCARHVIRLVPQQGTIDDREDDDLVRLAKHGRPEAFEALVRRHQGRVFGFASRYLGDYDQATEAVQRAFLALYDALPNYAPRGRFAGFLTRIVLNHCRMMARTARTKLRVLSKVSGPSSPRLPDETLIEREKQQELAVAVSTLDEPFRAVILLRFSAGCSYKEIAAELAVPLGTVKSRMATGIARLRQLLERGEDGP